MFYKKNSPFATMILGAISGIVLGIAFGLVFGVLIGYLASFFSPPGRMMMDGPLATYEFPAFLGMGAGAIIGAILGGLSFGKK